MDDRNREYLIKRIIKLSPRKLSQLQNSLGCEVSERRYKKRPYFFPTYYYLFQKQAISREDIYAIKRIRPSKFVMTRIEGKRLERVVDLAQFSWLEQI